MTNIKPKPISDEFMECWNLIAGQGAHNLEMILEAAGVECKFIDGIEDEVGDKVEFSVAAVKGRNADDTALMEFDEEGDLSSVPGQQKILIYLTRIILAHEAKNVTQA